MSRWALSRPQPAQTRSGRPLTFSAAGWRHPPRRHEKSPAREPGFGVGRCEAVSAARCSESFRRDGVRRLLGIGRFLRTTVLRVGEERGQSVR